MLNPASFIRILSSFLLLFVEAFEFFPRLESLIRSVFMRREKYANEKLFWLEEK